LGEVEKWRKCVAVLLFNSFCQVPRYKKIPPFNPNSVLLKPEKNDDALHWEVPVPAPRFNPDVLNIDENVVGSVADVQIRESWQKKDLTAFQMWEAIKRHGVSINPVTKIPRYVGLLLKLEEMGLKGNLEAIKLFFDSVVGKQPDNLTVTNSHTTTLSDKDLLDIALSVGQQKSVKNTEGAESARTSQEAEIIEG
jgi:hypothetical protein